MEEARRDNKPKMSDSQRESGGQDDRQDGKIKV